MDAAKHTQNAFSRNPTGGSKQERRARIEAVATYRIQTKTNKPKNRKQALRDRGEQSDQEKQMKRKARNALIIAGIILAALIVGGMDNDYEAQHNSERETCNWITTPDGAGACR